MTERIKEGRQLLMRWATVLGLCTVAACWATYRMNKARVALEDATHSATMIRTSPGRKPSSHQEESAPRQLYMCTMPECNDTPSSDPQSRCPVCGMKREPIDMGLTGDPSTAELQLSEEGRQLAQVATESAARRRLFKHIRTVGKVAYDETRHKMVTAWIDGRIDRLFADYTGMVVKEGDHLVELYSPNLVTAQEELIIAIRSVKALGQGTPEAHRRAERLVRSAERQLELLGVTREQIDLIKARNEASTRLTIHAPIGGTIVRKPAMEGAYVKTGDALYEIADLDYVWLMLDLYESDLPWIAPLQKVRVTTDGLPGHEFIGQIAFVDPIVDRLTRTIKVRVNISNRDGLLKPELFVNAEVFVALADAQTPAIPKAEGDFVCPMHPWEASDTVGTCRVCGMAQIPIKDLPGYRPPRNADDVLAVPREAVLQTGKRSLVYIEKTPGTYMSTEVEIGPLAEDDHGREYYAVFTGLTGGEQVVVRGNFAIDSQMQLVGKNSLFGANGRSAHGVHDHKGGMPLGEAAPNGPFVARSSGQTICPVMGNDVDAEVFTDFHGVRVFFCCPPCIEKFTANPEEYMPKLPSPIRDEIHRAMKGGREHD